MLERSDGYVDVTGGPKAYFELFRNWHPVERRAMRLVPGRVLEDDGDEDYYVAVLRKS